MTVTSLGDSCMSWTSILDRDRGRDLGRENYVKQAQLISAQLERPQRSSPTSLDSAGYNTNTITFSQPGSRGSPLSTTSGSSCTSPSQSQPPSSNICSICNTGFTGSSGTSNYNRHMKSFHLNQPLTCAEPSCGKQFRRSDYLKKHYKTAHTIP